MPKFSILSSFHLWNELKKKQLQRCVSSVRNNGFKDWEMILVDDGSTIPYPTIEFENIKVFSVPHLERVVALNKAIEESRGEWIALLDADDEYFSFSLEIMNQMVEKSPDYKLINCASLHVHKDFGCNIRGAFKPEVEGQGHKTFGGGNIVNGTFFFHRDIYEKLGAFPKKDKMWNPWDFSIEAQREFPEIKQFFTHRPPDHPEGLPRELGNPWGQDYYLFYKYTRQYYSKPYDIPIVIIHHEGREGNGHQVTN